MRSLSARPPTREAVALPLVVYHTSVVARVAFVLATLGIVAVVFR